MKKNRFLFVFAVFLSVSRMAVATPFEPIASPRDHVIVLAKASTIREVVEQTLDSVRFVNQIADYNHITDLSTVITDGSIIRIPTPYLEQRQTGVVAFSKGDVALIQSERVVNPTPRGTRVQKGDQLKTGNDGFVSLSFRSGTVVNVQPDSHIVVNNIDCVNEFTKCVIALRAEKGVVSSRVDPRTTDKPQIQYTVETPFLSAAVRGTAFYVDVRNDAGRLGVSEGLVAAESSRTTTMLPRGKGLLARDGYTPEQIDLLVPPEWWMANGDRLSREDTIHWSELGDAKSYQLTIATDVALDQPISVDRVGQPGAGISLSQPGQYYASLAGIDDKDFVGLPVKTTSFIFSDIDESAERPELVVVRHGSTIDISIPGYNGDVELIYGENIVNPTERRILNFGATSAVSLNVDPSQPFVVRARKLLGDYLVSRYSDMYVFDALDK